MPHSMKEDYKSKLTVKLNTTSKLDYFLEYMCIDFIIIPDAVMKYSNPCNLGEKGHVLAHRSRL